MGTQALLTSPLQEVSGGERRRTLFARVFAQRARDVGGCAEEPFGFTAPISTVEAC